MENRDYDLWRIIDWPYVDSTKFARAIEEELAHEPLDYRTRLLIRDGVNALRSHWGKDRVDHWLDRSPGRNRIEAICAEEFERPGFHFLEDQLVEPTKPETIRRLLRELGATIHQDIKVDVGGSCSLILRELLVRKTDDIDIVDEVPAPIRNLHTKLHEIEKTYRLKVGHFQSHYLPSGWKDRTTGLEPFDRLQVRLVDPYDIFLSKLSSIRQKDKQDMEVLMTVLDKEVLADRCRRTMQSVFAAEELHKRGKDNWYVLFGDALPQ